MSKSADKPSTKKVRAAPRAGITESDVKRYLRAHPNFLIDNPDLLRTLTPPAMHEGDGVVDMQRFLLDRLRSELDRLSSNQSELIATTRSNMSSLTQIQSAILALLEATSLEHLIHVATHDFAQILDLDIVTISIECADGAERFDGLGLYMLKPGTIERVVGEEPAIVLRESAAESDAIFGPAAALVKSDALVRLDLGEVAIAGLFALGSREENRFHPGQGTELLSFLSRVLERCIVAWCKRHFPQP